MLTSVWRKARAAMGSEDFSRICVFLISEDEDALEVSVLLAPPFLFSLPPGVLVYA